MNDHNLEQGTNLVLCERLGISRRTYERWKRAGVPAFRADAIAVALGFHPMDVWGDAWLEDES
jgi:hypothetical protein